jgi:hypothetical protein
MKLKTLCLTGILVLSVCRVAAMESNASHRQTAKPPEVTSKFDKYAGYSMDGWTSASKLAAQHSHTVAGNDERNFAVFSGVVAILMVVFVSQIILGKK